MQYKRIKSQQLESVIRDRGAVVVVRPKGKRLSSAARARLYIIVVIDLIVAFNFFKFQTPILNNQIAIEEK